MQNPGGACTGTCDSVSGVCGGCTPFTLGATAHDIATMLQAQGSDIDPSTAAWVRDPNGTFALGYATNPPKQLHRMWMLAGFRDYVPPGGVENLPTLEDVLGPQPPLPPPTHSGYKINPHLERAKYELEPLAPNISQSIPNKRQHRQTAAEIHDQHEPIDIHQLAVEIAAIVHRHLFRCHRRRPGRLRGGIASGTHRRLTRTNVPLCDSAGCR